MLPYDRQNSNARLGWVVAAVLTTVGLVLYARVIFLGAFLFDDFEYVVGNPIISDYTALRLNDPRQVGYISFMLNHVLGGDVPWGYHLVNVLIHIVNAVLVFSLVRTLFRWISPPAADSDRQDGIAFLSAILFLVHPLQTQAVSYVTQRFTSLATLFYLAGVLFYLHARSRFETKHDDGRGYALYGISLLSALLAMRTKEIAFTLPFLLFLFEAIAASGSRWGRRRYLYLLPYLALLLIIPLSLLGPQFGLLGPGVGVAEVTRQEKLYDLFERPVTEYLFTQFRVIVIYLRLLLFPYPQSVVYDLKASRSFFEPAVLLSFLLLAGIMAYGVHAWRAGSRRSPAVAGENRLIAVGIAWFFLTLSIESSVIPIKDLIFEHRAYLPNVGAVMVAAVALRRFAGPAAPAGTGRTAPLRVLLSGRGAAVAALLVALATVTIVRNEVWLSEMSMWNDVVKKMPNKAIGYHNRGNAYAKEGKYERALEDMNKTLEFFPKRLTEKQTFEESDFTLSNMAKTYMNRAMVLEILGRKDLAERDHSQARRLIELQSLDKDRVLMTADLYMKKGAYRHAIDELNKILELDPENLSALNDRANAFSWTKRYPEAIRDLSKIIDIDPRNALAYHNRGIAYAWSDRTAAALEDFTRACGLGFQPSCSSGEVLRQQQDGR